MEKVFTHPHIKGISATLPKNRLHLKELHFDGKAANDIIAMTGIEEIRTADSDRTASDYCIDAARYLLHETGVSAETIDGIVFVSVHSDYRMPGSGYIVQERLGIPKTAIIMDLHQACSGYVGGLFQAFLLVQSSYCKNVLLCVGDTPTKSIHPKDKSLRMVMGDAGTATLVTKESYRESAFSFFNDGTGVQSLYIPAGGSRLPHQAGCTDIEEQDGDGNIRTKENMYMDGLSVMLFLLNSAPDIIMDALSIVNWHKEQIDIFAFHQANALILKTLSKRMHIPPDKVVNFLQFCGNTGSASIPLALCGARSATISAIWDKTVLCGFGSGLSCVAAVLSLKDTYFSSLHEL